jgi:hypothetical protein
MRDEEERHAGHANFDRTWIDRIPKRCGDPHSKQLTAGSHQLQRILRGVLEDAWSLVTAIAYCGHSDRPIKSAMPAIAA